jgi:hypothetical protein
MTPTDQILLDAAHGNRAAHDFLVQAALHFHAVDDVVDVAPFDPLAMLECFRQVVEIYSHPFYLDHGFVLKGVMLTLLRQYRDSVEYQQLALVDGTFTYGWARATGDVLRHAGNELVIAVAQICGGTKLADQISFSLRQQSWREHHDDAGQPI